MQLRLLWIDRLRVMTKGIVHLASLIFWKNCACAELVSGFPPCPMHFFDSLTASHVFHFLSSSRVLAHSLHTRNPAVCAIMTKRRVLRSFWGPHQISHARVKCTATIDWTVGRVLFNATPPAKAIYSAASTASNGFAPSTSC